jgi:undecaprenyl-diphosphatase
MSIMEAILLGIAQGLTEFLPVSSSGHLVVLQHIMGFKEPLLTFDIMIHLGTLAAVLIYYRKRLTDLVVGMFGTARASALRTIMLVIVATLPAVVIGLAFKDTIEEAFGDPNFVAVMWFLFGILAIISTRWTKGTRSFESLSFYEAF